MASDVQRRDAQLSSLRDLLTHKNIPFVDHDLRSLVARGYYNARLLSPVTEEKLMDPVGLSMALAGLLVQEFGAGSSQGAGTGQKQGSHKGSRDGKKSAQRSPEGPSHHPPARSVAFGCAKHLLNDYCPKLEMRSFDEGLQELRTLDIDNFDIRPRELLVPEDVLDYLLPLLQICILGPDVCSKNEATSVLKIYEVIKLLLRCCPWTVQAKAQLTELEQDKLEVVEGGQEASSPMFTMQRISHKTWQHVPGFVKGRVELQIVCNRSDNKKYLLGACEVANELHTPELLNAKLQQVAKEALAFAIKNAKAGTDSLPVKMLLTDGLWFMRVDLKLSTVYKRGMNLHELAGDFSFSAAYPLLWSRGVKKEDAYDAVRLLLSWLWDGPWEELSKDLLVNAMKAAEERDNDKIKREKGHFDLQAKRKCEG